MGPCGGLVGLSVEWERQGEALGWVELWYVLSTECGLFSRTWKQRP